MARYERKPGVARGTIGVRVGDDERVKIEAAAAVRGLPVSAYVRAAALQRAREDLGAES